MLKPLMKTLVFQLQETSMFNSRNPINPVFGSLMPAAFGVEILLK